MKVYELHRNWKILRYVQASVVLCLMLAMAISPLVSADFMESYSFLGPASYILIISMVYVILQVDKKIIVDDVSVRQVSRLVNRKLLLADVEGYKIKQKGAVHIIPYKGHGKKIVVDPDIWGMSELLSWLNKHYKNLGSTVIAEEDDLENEEYPIKK